MKLVGIYHFGIEIAVIFRIMQAQVFCKMSPWALISGYLDMEQKTFFF